MIQSSTGSAFSKHLSEFHFQTGFWWLNTCWTKSYYFIQGSWIYWYIIIMNMNIRNDNNVILREGVIKICTTKWFISNFAQAVICNIIGRCVEKKLHINNNFLPFSEAVKVLQRNIEAWFNKIIQPRPIPANQISL